MAEHNPKEDAINREATLREQYKWYNLDRIETGAADLSFAQWLKQVKGLNPADVLGTAQ